MRFPFMTEIPNQRTTVSNFAGYNHNLRIRENEFYDMKNMTSDYYPLLSPRGKRGELNPNYHAQCLASNGDLCWLSTSGELHYKDGVGNEKTKRFPNQNPGETNHYLVPFASYIILMPEGSYININDDDDNGSIEAHYEADSTVTFSLCDIDGNDYTISHTGSTEPSEHQDGAYWMDTSGDKSFALKVWYESTSTWVTVPTTYVRIHASGIGRDFRQYDGVTIDGITAAQPLSDLNGTNLVIQKVVNRDNIVIIGILPSQATQDIHPQRLTIDRKMPLMDFVVESNNRLWGCRCGVERTHGGGTKFLNEIYASKLGDFTNWNCFMGTSMDSYVASCGTEGLFTGAVSHMGYPVFFKEDCIHKVYGNYPSNFQVQSRPCHGVQRGSHKSVCVINDIVYYRGTDGVYAYDGSVPTKISNPLGDLDKRYINAVGGYMGDKYYISMYTTGGGPRSLFVYDTEKGLWHREDDTTVTWFANADGELYYMDSTGNTIKTIGGSGVAIRRERDVEWSVTTGVIGLDIPDNKYVSRMLVKAALAPKKPAADGQAEVPASVMEGYIQYDSVGKWERVFSIKGKSLRTFNIPIRPRRCDHFRLRIEGKGEAKIYSITKTIEQGSDV